MFEDALKRATPSMGYKNELVKNLSAAIKTRFQTMHFGKCVVVATRILKLKTWPSDKEELRGLILFNVVHYCLHFISFDSINSKLGSGRMV